MYKSVELFKKPHDILKDTTEAYCEMTENEHGFLCGLIKDVKPQKILEVGVAGGGTTCVIMKCLDIVNPEAKMYSVDLNRICYRRKEKQTGFQLEEVKDYISNYSNHTFLLGGILPRFLDDIGRAIDFCVLDTVHSMPGEILDFLAVLPYLQDGAVVVMHDVVNNLMGSCNIAYATKVLLDAVSGDKYYNYRDSIMNIAAFKIIPETREKIANVFSALSISWAGEQSIRDLMCYRDLYKKNYDDECIELFDIFWDMNSVMLAKHK